MAYTYQPLQGNDIRLLTLQSLDENADDTSPICCVLEHVSLPELSDAPPVQRFKGETYHWPEIEASCDASIIFRRRPDPSAPSKGFPVTVPDSARNGDLSADQDLPWRHSWGDYIALSYSWGPPEPRRTINLDGHPFTVTPNLFDALQLLRRSRRTKQGFKLWIDAICINQDDAPERGRQVVRMRDIYASAWQVVTYLGAEADDNELAMTAFRWMASRVDATADPLAGFYREPTKVSVPVLGSMIVSWSSVLRGAVYKAIFCFLTRPYWRRMWILQEVAMARDDAPVACGNRYLSWSQICSAASLIKLDQGRFDRDIVSRSRPKEAQHGTFEFARGRLIEEEEYSSERTWELLLDMQDLRRAQAPRQAPGSEESRMDFLKLLLLARKANVTDNKDRVYGILGMRMVAERVVVVPDYTLSTSAIYQNFAQELLSGGDLNTLRLAPRHRTSIHGRWNFGNSLVIEGKPIINSLLASARKAFSAESQKESWVGSECPHELPSWAICWTCKPAPTAHLHGRYRAGGDATTPSPAIFSGPTLRVRGMAIDLLSSLGSFHPAEVDAEYPHSDNHRPTPSSAYGDVEATRAALWRTVVANTTAQGGSPAPESYSCLLDRRVWKFGSVDVEANGFGPHEIMGRNKGLVLSGHTLEELAFGPTTSSSWRKTRKEEREEPSQGGKYMLTTLQLEALSWAMNSLAWRRLAGTKEGRMGLASAGAKVGDSVAVLVGCDVPMILRKCETGEGWRVVGECYVHGVMDGEALKNRSGDVDDILLH